MTVPPPMLTDDEIDSICDPLTQSSAQVKYMRSLGMVVNRKPGGRPLVARDEFKRVAVRQSGAAAVAGEAQPNRDALRDLFRGKQNGAQAQK